MSKGWGCLSENKKGNIGGWLLIDGGARWRWRGCFPQLCCLLLHFCFQEKGMGKGSRWREGEGSVLVVFTCKNSEDEGGEVVVRWWCCGGYWWCSLNQEREVERGDRVGEFE